MSFCKPSATGRYISSPLPDGTEIGGNHTDHNHGRVLAASVNLDVIAVACRRPGTRIRIQSQGYPLDTVDCGDIQINPGGTQPLRFPDPGHSRRPAPAGICGGRSGCLHHLRCAQGFRPLFLRRL